MASDMRIGLMSGEFLDPAHEESFRRDHLEGDARRLVATLAFGGVLFPVFGVYDVVNLGWTRTALILLLLRCVVLVSALMVAVRVHRSPEQSYNDSLVSGVEIVAMAVFLMVCMVVPDLSTRNLQFCILSLAFFIFIPNRVVNATAVVAVASLVFVGLGLAPVNGGPSVGFEEIMTIVVIVAVGAATSAMLSRSRREEFVAFMKQQRAKELLEHEIHQRTILQGELEYLANHDALTDLLNRRSFFEESEKEFSKGRRTGHPVSVLVIDADEFKQINDMFGHHTGDEAIKVIARLAKLSLRSDDVLGRVGGEEFAVVMPGTTLGLAHEVASRLRERIAEALIEHPDGPVHLTVSIGATECKLWEETIQESLQRADAAMYDAKQAGRNRVVGV